MEDTRTKIVVFNEHTLGYIVSLMPNTLHVLRVNVSKGATFEILPSSKSITSDDTIRLASKEDFINFRLNLNIFNNPNMFVFKD